LVHCECAIECCRAVGIVYTLEDGKSAKCPNHHKSFKKRLNSFQEIDNNGGNSDEIDQRSDSNKGSGKEDSSDEGQKDDESTKKKGANVDGDDEESGKDSGTEGADQVKSSCNLNVDGGKEQSGKEGATKGSCEKNISAETEESKGNIDRVDEHGMGDNVIGENREKSSANENNDGGKEQSGKVGRTEGSGKKDGSDEEEKDYQLTKKKEQTMMEMMKNQRKKTKETVMQLMNAVMEITVLVIIVKNPVPMKIMMAVKNNQGKMVELKEIDKEDGSDDKEKDDESNKDNKANNDGDDDKSGKDGGTDGSGNNDSNNITRTKLLNTMYLADMFVFLLHRSTAKA
jgi:hypothetical protein